MHGSDRQAFTSLFTRVARSFNKKPDPLQCESYFSDLEDIPLAVVEAAADQLRRTARFFPKVVEWRTAAQKVHKPLPITRPEPVVEADGTVVETVYCADCDDTGWRPDCGCPLASLAIGHKCLAHPYVRFGNVYPNPVRACACRPHNPAWQAQHPARYAEPEQGRS
jgi:hypothetical protein